MAALTAQKIRPQLMFEGRAREAMTFYVSLFGDAEVLSLTQYGPGGPGPEGSVEHAVFALAGQQFTCIDSYLPHGFGFTAAISLSVRCDSAAEMERLWAALADGGTALMPPGEYGGRRLGWVTDRFGVSWLLILAGAG